MEISEFVDREVGLLSRCALPWWRETLEATLKLGYFAGSLSRKKPAVDSNVSTRDSLFIKRCYDILDSQLVWNTDSNVSTRDSLFIKRCYDILDSQLVWNTIGEQ